MVKHTVRKDTYTYAKTILACAKGGEVDLGLYLLSEMKRRHGVDPGMISLSAAMKACSMGRRPEKAIELLRDMKREGVRPNAVVYNAAILACTKGVRPEKGLNVLKQMRNDGISPDLITYNTVMSGLARRKPQGALDLLEEMRRSRIRLDAHCSFTDDGDDCVRVDRGRRQSTRVA